MEYSACDDETGMVSLDVESGVPDRREAQKLLSEGLVDMLILKGEDIEVGEKQAGKDYDSEDNSMSLKAPRTPGCTRTGSTASRVLR